MKKKMSRWFLAFFRATTHKEYAAQELADSKLELLEVQTCLELWAAKRDATMKRVQRLSSYVNESTQG